MTKWAIVTDEKYVSRNGKLAWTYSRAEADSWAKSIPDAHVVDGEKFLAEQERQYGTV